MIFLDTFDKIDHKLFLQSTYFKGDILFNLSYVFLKKYIRPSKPCYRYRIEILCLEKNILETISESLKFFVNQNICFRL